MTKRVFSSMLINFILNVLKTTDKDMKRIVITIDRGKQIADAGDQYILEHTVIE